MKMSLGEYADVPEQLKTMLLEANGSSYANGFFRFVSPVVFNDFLSLWKLDPSECFTFIKCAFGHLIFYHRREYKLLDPLFNRVEVLGGQEKLGFVMDIVLCDRPALENSFAIDIYEQVFPRIGAPGIDEIYAFVPSLGLGGSRNASHVQKRQMAVEMPILSQL
jgi:hypothetical protein